MLRGPLFHQAGVLARREVPGGPLAARKQIAVGRQLADLDPTRDRVHGACRQFQAHRPAGLLLDDLAARLHGEAVGDVGNSKTKEIASTKLAIDCQVEQGEVSGILSGLQADSQGPHLLLSQRGFLSY